MNKKLLGILLVLFITFSFGCGKKSASSMPQGAANKATADMAVGNAPMAPTATAAAEVKAKAPIDENTDKIIKTYDIYIIAGDIKKASDDIHSKIKSLNGYVQEENIDEYRSSSTIRVPAETLDSFIEYLGKSYEVKTSRITTQNVTEAYVDNDARIRNLKAQEAQILEIMKKANTVDEVLKVQSELYKVRGDIESFEAKKNMWDKQVGYATITLRLERQEIVADNKLKIIGGNDFFKAIGKGFNNTGIVLILAIQNIFIFLFSKIVILLIIGAVGYFIYKRYKKNHKMP